MDVVRLALGAPPMLAVRPRMPLGKLAVKEAVW